MTGRTRTRHRLAAIALAVLLVVPSGAGALTGGSTPHGPVFSTDDEGVSAEGDVAFARTVEEMKGHLTVSVEAKQNGNTERAAVHAHHPYEEYWAVVGPKVNASNATLAAEVETALRAADDRARNDSASEYSAYVDDTVYPLLDDATASVVETDTANPAFNAKVSRDLMQRATQEYAEGVAANGTITDEAEHADARGFALRAEAVYRDHVRATLSEEDAAEIGEMFDNLQAAITAADPPEAVERVTASIAGEYGEYVGIDSEVESAGVSSTITEIEEHLHDAVEAYENGNTKEAKSVVRQTYLSYFEGLEGDLIEVRPELVEELEVDFNEDLPGLMDENASVSQVNAEVESMEGKLHEAERALESQNESSIDLDDGTTTPTQTTATAVDTATTTAASAPGFGFVVAVVAVVAVALVTVRSRAN